MCWIESIILCIIIDILLLIIKHIQIHWVCPTSTTCVCPTSTTCVGVTSQGLYLGENWVNGCKSTEISTKLYKNTLALWIWQCKLCKQSEDRKCFHQRECQSPNSFHLSEYTPQINYSVKTLALQKSVIVNSALYTLIRDEFTLWNVSGSCLLHRVRFIQPITSVPERDLFS